MITSRWAKEADSIKPGCRPPEYNDDDLEPDRDRIASAGLIEIPRLVHPKTVVWEESTPRFGHLSSLGAEESDGRTPAVAGFQAADGRVKPRHAGRKSRSGEHQQAPRLEGLGLVAHRAALDVIRRLYPLGTAFGSVVMLACGGFIPVLRRWLADEIRLGDFRAVVGTLGGVWPSQGASHPDTDLGPVVSLLEAPGLHAEVAELSRRLGTRPPPEIRLTYLPCCGIVAYGHRARALLIGLPLLPVLTKPELRAVLAHELSHWARDDAGRTARATRFVDELARGLAGDRDQNPGRRSISPLHLWARACLALSRRWLAPIATGQEARADRASAALAGGDAAASALVKVALVQPLFREVLSRYDPEEVEIPNLFAFFRAFWHRLPESMITSLRHGILSDRRAPLDTAHPALLDRMASVQNHSARTRIPPEPATAVVADLEALEQKLHDWLFTSTRLESSVFHRAGS
jgi:hypothetical protein